MDAKIITTKGLGCQFLNGTTSRLRVWSSTKVPSYCLTDIGSKVYFSLDSEGIFAAKILGFVFLPHSYENLSCDYVKVVKPNGKIVFIPACHSCFKTKDDCMAYIMGDTKKGFNYQSISSYSNLLIKDIAKDILIYNEDTSQYNIGYTYYYKYGHINSVERKPLAIYIDEECVYLIKANIEDEMVKYNSEGCRLYETKEECFKDNAPKTVMDFVEDDKPVTEEIKIVEPTTNNTTYIIFKRD